MQNLVKKNMTVPVSNIDCDNSLTPSSSINSPGSQGIIMQQDDEKLKV